MTRLLRAARLALIAAAAIDGTWSVLSARSDIHRGEDHAREEQP